MKKLLVVSTFFFGFAVTRAQIEVIPNLADIYQQILDDEQFVSTLLSDSSFLCNGVPLHLPTHSDSIFNLTFNGIALKKFSQNGIGDTTSCARLWFALYKVGSRRFRLTAEMVKPIEPSGSYRLWKRYDCILKKKGNVYIIKKGRVKNGWMHIKFL